MNKPIIYCFSATGNSMRAALIIAKKIGGEIQQITTATPLECYSGVIGLVFPTFYLGMPGLVKQFVSKIVIKNPDAYIFAVTTCGKIYGKSIGQIKEIWEKRNLKLNYGGVIYTVANNICEYNIAVDKVDAKLDRADLQAHSMADEIHGRKQNLIPDWPITSRLFYRLYESKYPTQDQHFSTDLSCTGCGVCVKVCPANNISIHNMKPKFYGQCENCLACIHWCPTKTLQWKNRTSHRERYHHPKVSINDLNKTTT